MASRAVPATIDHKAQRLCPRCGYRGAELQGTRGRLVIACPRCREDLYSRPARSYLEMEGFTDTAEFGWSKEPRASGADHAHANEHHDRRPLTARGLALRVSLTTVVCAGLFLAVSLATVAALSS